VSLDAAYEARMTDTRPACIVAGRWL